MDISHMDSKRLTTVPSTQSDRIGHWSHLSDLPSQCTPTEHTTICATCYLKWLLICIWMIMMYHNENVTSPGRHNEHEHCIDISIQHSWVTIALRNHDHAVTLVCQRSTYAYGTQGCINGLKLKNLSYLDIWALFEHHAKYKLIRAVWHNDQLSC